MTWFGGRSDDDYRDEIHAHIEAETQANIGRGLSPDEALRTARAAFGSVASVRQRLHEGQPDYWLSALGRDVRFGLRTILKHKLLSCIVVLTMSVGIGGTTAVFSLINAIVFAPPVSHDPDSFVLFVDATTSQPYRLADTARYEALRDQSRSLREIAAWSSNWAAAPFGADDATSASALLASCNLFKVISGAPALAGRLLEQSDCDARLPVAVISERAWRRRFSSDPGIVGKSVVYGKHVITVVGVASVEDPSPAAAALWLPYTLQPQMEDLFDVSARGTCNPPDSPACRAWIEAESKWLNLAGRLAPGYPRAAAAAELKVLMSREAFLDPAAAELKLSDGSLWSTGARDVVLTLTLVLTLPTLIALIVCANVASLLLSRAVKRQQEMAIRLAIGGSRLKLVRMLLVEQMLLAGVAAVLSLWLIRVLPSVIVKQIPEMSQVIQSGTGPDWRVLAYLAVVALLTAIGAGMAPALESLNVQLGQSLKGRGAQGGRRAVSRTQGLLICSQVALSMVPVVTVAALVRAEQRMASPGFDASQVVVAEVDPARARAALEWPIDQLQALEAVRSVTLSTSFPPNIDRMVAIEGGGVVPRKFPVSAVSPSYFRTLGITLVSGRPFRDEDYIRGDSERVAIVSEAFARRVFPAQDAVGKTFDVPAEGKRFEIVGVAADVLTRSDQSAVADRSLIYQLIDRSSDSPIEHKLLVSFTGDAQRFAPLLQSMLKPQMGMFVSVNTLQSVLDGRLEVLRVVRTLVMAPAAIGLALALIGVFGILAFTAAQRRKEVAIRAAIGASRADIFGGIIRPALRPTGLGIAIGAAASFGALRFFESTTSFVAQSADLVPYLVAACLLLCAALAAMSSPAWRAATADPLSSLRED